MTIAEIPRRALIVGTTFAPSLDPDAVVRAIAAGMRAGGGAEPDTCPLDLSDDATPQDVAQALMTVGFDQRMRAARAVVVAALRLDERTLAGSATFEVATRARQGGVPVYAVAGENALSCFDARMLDLQEILLARTTRTLEAAGAELAAIVSWQALPA